MIDLKISRLAKWVRCFPVLLAVLMLSGRASGQPVTEPPQRWLLIFDTSITMQRWLPGTTTELQNLFYGSMSEQLRAGDSVGVWVFDEKLHTDLCLPFTWQPAKAADEASQLKDFLTQQHYFGSTKFSVLGPVLQRVIAGSQRLTIVLFCDGKDELKLTPYDDSINGTFRAMQADRKKAKDPFILVVRTQLGKFVGATVNLPPGSLDFPVFPPLPVSDKPVPTHPPVMTEGGPAGGAALGHHCAAAGHCGHESPHQSGRHQKSHRALAGTIQFNHRPMIGTVHRLTQIKTGAKTVSADT